MNEPINDGGYAFPNHHNPNDRSLNELRGGMSLRDYFAGQTLAGVLANPKTGCVDGDLAEFDAALSLRSYQIADAMLAERAKAKP